MTDSPPRIQFSLSTLLKVTALIAFVCAIFPWLPVEARIVAGLIVAPYAVAVFFGVTVVDANENHADDD